MFDIRFFILLKAIGKNNEVFEHLTTMLKGISLLLFGPRHY